MNFPIIAAALPCSFATGGQTTGWERWLERAADMDDDPDLATFMRALAAATDTPPHCLLDALFCHSPYLTLSALHEAAFVRQMLELGPEAALRQERESLSADVANCPDMAALMQRLRLGKRRVALLVAAADIAGAWSLEQVTETLSDFAEFAVRAGLRFLLAQEHKRGTLVLPHPDDPERDSGVLILGMGKFGARELNYSSDIDIIVFYDPDCLVYQGRRTLGEAMVTLTRDLVKILDERTGQGYVFRTDLRLRPDPGSTPVAVSIPAAEIYYEGFGQNWERAAMIKARPVAGDPQTGEAFLKFLRPFIWRRSLDFAAIADIHSIKRQINAHKSGHSIAVAGHNIKLGRGGIREIEFFVQTQQLIWGGRQPEMRGQQTLTCLNTLATIGHVTPQVAGEMAVAYRALRRLEHRLQMIDDQQTQTLPDTPERLAAVAAFCGFADVESFSTSLLEQLRIVERHYAHLFEHAPELGTTEGNLAFTGSENDPETVHTIAQMGFKNADPVCATIRGWHHGRIRATRSTRARELLTELTPALLKALGNTASPDEAFSRFDEFLSRLPAGVPLFAMFHAHPSLLSLVAEIMGNAPRLADHLARHANLLDVVLTASFFDPLPPLPDLIADMSRTLEDARDEEDILNLCRRWANDHRFQVGTQLLRTMVTPDQAAHGFTAIADAVLTVLCPRLEAVLTPIHGAVPGGGWCLLAMGKMGGMEMTTTSDLDLILVYDAPEAVEESDGRRPLSVSAWYGRLTQKLVTALTVKTNEGALYEVDMRLRPSGSSGPIASSFEAFARYQKEMAWTWEHLALTRARVVTGDPVVADKVNTLIREVLTAPRDAAKLVADVADMREKMADNRKGDSPWEVKHRRGGLIDIEFIAQYLQLRYGHDHPLILSTNTRLALDRACEAGVLSTADHDVLVEAWRLWSAVQTVLRQTVAGAFNEDTAPHGLKDVLVTASGLVDFKTLRDRMDDLAAASFAVFKRLINPSG